MNPNPSPIGTMAGFGLSCFGGDKRDRTADLLTASQTLSQLSYTPMSDTFASRLIQSETRTILTK